MFVRSGYDRLRAALAYRLDAPNVCIVADMAELPEGPVVWPPGYSLREMDVHSDTDLEHWLVIQTEAFGWRWDRNLFRREILEHPHLCVTYSFFLVHDGRPVGTASLGHFRRNPDVAMGHYYGLLREERGGGIARRLWGYSFIRMRDLGFRVYEQETTMAHKASLALSFDFGFRPKRVRDHWNTPDNASPLLRRIANARLERLYRERLRKRPPGLSPLEPSPAEGH